MSNSTTDKWLWMMGWCKKNGVPPANNEIWKIAENAYNKELNK